MKLEPTAGTAASLIAKFGLESLRGVLLTDGTRQFFVKDAFIDEAAVRLGATGETMGYEAWRDLIEVGSSADGAGSESVVPGALRVVGAGPALLPQWRHEWFEKGYNNCLARVQRVLSFFSEQDAPGREAENAAIARLADEIGLTRSRLLVPLAAQRQSAGGHQAILVDPSLLQDVCGQLLAREFEGGTELLARIEKVLVNAGLPGRPPAAVSACKKLSPQEWPGYGVLDAVHVAGVHVDVCCIQAQSTALSWSYLMVARSVEGDDWLLLSQPLDKVPTAEQIRAGVERLTGRPVRGYAVAEWGLQLDGAGVGDSHYLSEPLRDRALDEVVLSLQGPVGSRCVATFAVLPNGVHAGREYVQIADLARRIAAGHAEHERTRLRG